MARYAANAPTNFELPAPICVCALLVACAKAAIGAPIFLPLVQNKPSRQNECPKTKKIRMTAYRIIHWTSFPSMLTSEPSGALTLIHRSASTSDT
jgi:hypothetical protein